MNYRTGFFVLLVVAAGLAAGIVVSWSNSRPPAPQSGSAAPEAAPPASAQSNSKAESNAAPKLVPLQLSPQRMQTIGVTFAPVLRKAVEDHIRVAGNVDLDEERLSYVQTRFPGWIQKVFANANYQYVRKGEPLFTIYSQELAGTEQELLLALRNRQSAGSQSGTAGQEAGWLVDAARQRLRQWNVPEDQIAQLERTGKAPNAIPVLSPVSGFITDRNALPNQFVHPDTRLYTIADLSQVWVYAQVFQNDIGRIKLGDPATVTIDAYPGRSFRGRVQQILPQVDPATRTVRVRLIFDNPKLLLKPGMYVNVDLDVPLGTQTVVPVSGVLQSGTRQIVFLDKGNGYLEPRAVDTGPRVDDRFIVLKGLQAGERIVSSANFLIDSEAQLQAAAGQFAPPPPGAGGLGGTAAVTLAEQVNIEFSSTPSPPRKGNNVFRIKLSDPAGKPVAGANVKLTFFMPAMPAMGMAAMNASAVLVDRGNGVYEGNAALNSGGSWQVTIVAQKDGQTIASRRLSVTATGGM
ncbi:MAG TPA: FixH family protein [Terriglobales bacterium]|nr:FixH family protein [Terriglobales bacterium]